MLSSSPPQYTALPLAEDQYIETHNRRLEEHPCMRQYRDAQYNESLHAALGPPLRRLKSVPQSLYTANRKQPDIYVSICSPVEFWTIKSYGSGNKLALKGLKLADAIDGKPDGLCRASQSVWLGQSTRTSIRLRVNGYADHSEYISTVRATVGREGNKLVDIAEKVAVIVKRSMPLVSFGDTEVLQWCLPNGDIVKFEDVMLLELRHVTVNTWQPVLAYADLRF